MNRCKFLALKLDKETNRKIKWRICSKNHTKYIYLKLVSIAKIFLWSIAATKIDTKFNRFLFSKYVQISENHMIVFSKLLCLLNCITFRSVIKLAFQLIAFKEEEEKIDKRRRIALDFYWQDTCIVFLFCIFLI